MEFYNTFTASKNPVDYREEFNLRVEKKLGNGISKLYMSTNGGSEGLVFSRRGSIYKSFPERIISGVTTDGWWYEGDDGEIHEHKFDKTEGGLPALSTHNGYFFSNNNMKDKHIPDLFSVGTQFMKLLSRINYLCSSWDYDPRPTDYNGESYEFHTNNYISVMSVYTGAIRGDIPYEEVHCMLSVCNYRFGFYLKKLIVEDPTTGIITISRSKDKYIAIGVSAEGLTEPPIEYDIVDRDRYDRPITYWILTDECIFGIPEEDIIYGTSCKFPIGCDVTTKAVVSGFDDDNDNFGTFRYFYDDFTVVFASYRATRKQLENLFGVETDDTCRFLHDGISWWYKQVNLDLGEFFGYKNPTSLEFGSSNSLLGTVGVSNYKCVERAVSFDRDYGLREYEWATYIVEKQASYKIRMLDYVGNEGYSTLIVNAIESNAESIFQIYTDKPKAQLGDTVNVFVGITNGATLINGYSYYYVYDENNNEIKHTQTEWFNDLPTANVVLPIKIEYYGRYEITVFAESVRNEKYINKKITISVKREKNGEWFIDKPPMYDAKKVLEYKTQVLTSYTHTEDRLVQRDIPRLTFSYRYELSSNADAIKLYNAVQEFGLTNNFIVPDWLSMYKVERTDNIQLDENNQFINGQQVLVFSSDVQKLSYIEIIKNSDIYTMNLLDIDDIYTNVLIMPVHRCVITDISIDHSFLKNIIDVKFESLLPTYKSALPYDVKYETHDVLCDHYTLSNSVDLSMEQDLMKLDYSIGRKTISTLNKRMYDSFKLTMCIFTKEVPYFMNFMKRRFGKKNPFFIPSYFTNFKKLLDNNTIIGYNLHIKYTDHNFDTRPYIRIHFKNGKNIFTKVNYKNVVENGFRLVLEDHVSDKNSDIEYIDSLLFVRLDSDKITIKATKYDMFSIEASITECNFDGSLESDIQDSDVLFE